MPVKGSDPGGPSMGENDRYRLLVDSITDYAIYMLDAAGQVVSWNPGAERFKGYQPAEIIGQHFSVFYTPEDRAIGVPDAALRTAAEQGRFEAEGWRVRKDGARFWASIVIDPIRAPSGELLGFAKVTHDLTERRAAAEALRDSEEQLRLLVQGVTDYAIYMLTPEGQVRTWNSGAQRIKGYVPQEIIGEHFSRFYTAEDRAAERPAFGLATAAAEGRFEAEGWRVRKDGSRFWASVVIDAVRADDGRLLGFAKVTRDFTERREAQDELDRARETLFQAQKMEAIGQLTGGVAHDFNNLLMAILGSLELVRKKMPPDPRLTRLVDNAIQGAQRGAALTQRMLAFVRQQELKEEIVHVPGLVSGMLDLIERSIGGRVALETQFQADLPPVATDPNQLESAVLNLAVNARDAMPDGGLITISASEEIIDGEQAGEPLVAGRYLKLCVADTGSGMSPEIIRRATDPFFTTKEVGKGTGLGLSMVKGLTEQAGGKLRIRSELGKGSAVELWFPVACDEIGQPPEATEPFGQARVGPCAILAVDDDPLVLLNTAFMLEDLGHTVLRATSAAEALAILEGGARVDLVITDQIMPKMTGLQLANAIWTRWPQLPVILATGFAELPEESPGVTRLAKPFMQADLTRVLGSALSGRLTAI